MSTYPSIMIRTEAEAQRIADRYCKAKRITGINATMISNQLIGTVRHLKPGVATDVYFAGRLPDASFSWMPRDPNGPIHSALYPVNSIEQALVRLRRPSR